MKSITAVAELKQIISEPPTETDIATFKKLFYIVKGDINATKVLFLSARLTDSQAQNRAYREMHVRNQATVKCLYDCIRHEMGEMEKRFTKDSSKTDASGSQADNNDGTETIAAKTKTNAKGFAEATASKVYHDILTQIGADLSPRSPFITRPASPIELARKARTTSRKRPISPRKHMSPNKACRS